MPFLRPEDEEPNKDESVFPLPQTQPPNRTTANNPKDIKGWLVEIHLKMKKTRWSAPVEDLEAILGGWAITFGIVSRIEVREGTMGAPEMVVSQ